LEIAVVFRSAHFSASPPSGPNREEKYMKMYAKEIIFPRPPPPPPKNMKKIFSMQCRDLWRAAVFTVTLSMVTVGAFDILPLLQQCINSFLRAANIRRAEREKRRNPHKYLPLRGCIFLLSLFLFISLPSPNTCHNGEERMTMSAELLNITKNLSKILFLPVSESGRFSSRNSSMAACALSESG
jgi:hypothetical protein